MSDARVPVVLEIRRNSDGLTRRCPKTWIADDEYLWSEGNFGCDCNRALFFARAAGEPDPDDRPCGQEAFSLRMIGMDGAVVYEDGENWSPPTP